LVSSAKLPVFDCISGHFPLSGIYQIFESQAPFATLLQKSKSTTNSIRDRQTKSIITLQSPIRLRVEGFSTKNHEKPFSKKSGFFSCALHNFMICLRPVPPLQNGSNRNLLLARPLSNQNA